MKKIMMVTLLSLMSSFVHAQQDLSPAEREMVDIAKEKIKEMRDKKQQQKPVDQRLRDRMQSEAESGVTVEVPKKK